MAHSNSAAQPHFPEQAPARTAGRRQELLILLALSFVNGVVALDRLSVNFLSPFIVADLGLTNGQLGMVSAALSLSVSISGLVFGMAADSSGKRKLLLVISLLAFSILSAGSGLATGFATLFIARLLLGAGEGPIVPLAQSVMTSVSNPARRGMNMGIMQICGAFLIGATLGPPLAVAVAERFGWQMAFFLSGLPGLIGVAAVMLVVRDPARKAAAGPPPSGLPEPVPADPAIMAADVRPDTIRALFTCRNLLISMAIAGLFTGALTIQNIFMPLYLVKIDGFDPGQMSLVLSASGIGGLIGGFAVPALSDRLGRRPVVVGASLATAMAPLVMLFVHGPALVIALMMAVAWLVMGCAPLVCAVIPGESVAARRVTTAIALSMFSAETMGGVAVPPLAGWLADRHGLGAPFVMAIGLALCCTVLALFLKETAPRSLA